MTMLVMTIHRYDDEVNGDEVAMCQLASLPGCCFGDEGYDDEVAIGQLVCFLAAMMSRLRCVNSIRFLGVMMLRLRWVLFRFLGPMMLRLWGVKTT